MCSSSLPRNRRKRALALPCSRFQFVQRTEGPGSSNEKQADGCAGRTVNVLLPVFNHLLDGDRRYCAPSGLLVLDLVTAVRCLVPFQDEGKGVRPHYFLIVRFLSVMKIPDVQISLVVPLFGLLHDSRHATAHRPFPLRLSRLAECE
jgi:hypothetical protein